jgi:hypothetical protein
LFDRHHTGDFTSLNILWAIAENLSRSHQQSPIRHWFSPPVDSYPSPGPWIENEQSDFVRGLKGVTQRIIDWKRSLNGKGFRIVHLQEACWAIKHRSPYAPPTIQPCNDYPQLVSKKSGRALVKLASEAVPIQVGWIKGASPLLDGNFPRVILQRRIIHLYYNRLFRLVW